MTQCDRSARRISLLALALALLAPLAGRAAEPGPVNLDFEQGELGQTPTGWHFLEPSTEGGYSAILTEDRPKSGKRCVLLASSAKATATSPGILMQSFAAESYRGRRVRFRAWVRAEVNGAGNTAHLWLRVDRAGNKSGFFDNMGDRPIVQNEWRAYEIIGDVADDASEIALGGFLVGRGKVWFDAGSFEVLGKVGEGDEPPRPLDGRGLENLAAFARLFGYVRYFHPSDEAAATDWETFALAGVGVAEPARSPAELARALEKLFRPIAPTVRVFVTGQGPAAADLVPPGRAAASRILVWRHLGVGTGQPGSIYRSTRIDTRKPAADGPFGQKLPEVVFPDPQQPFTADLGAGVSCSVPLALYADDKGTLPHQSGVKPAPSAKPAGFRPSGRDRATRLAGVVMAWNVFQHFYPYFDVVKADWPAELRRALTKAAADADENAYYDTLRLLIAALQDGHGAVIPPGGFDLFQPSVCWDWVEERLVITRAGGSAAEGLRPGDVVVKVNGRPAAEALVDRERFISGATPQWKRYNALKQLAAGPRDSTLNLEVQTGAGKTRTVMLRRTLAPNELTEKRPGKVEEIKPGIFYVDLDRLTDAEFAAAVPRLEKARGVIFELRGYPRLSTGPLAHLTDKPVTSAQWQIPVVVSPDRRDMAFAFSNWTVSPQTPRFTGRAAFLTDGQAISYAETYLGIVEHYRLAEIVGGPTAGTNGNVNPFTLPGGYRISWTGMKVLKHDGSRHHGVGIQPTVPVARTLRGVVEERDEVLERAVELVGR